MPNATDPLLERDDGFLYGRAAVDEGTLSEEDRSVEVIASTEDIDRHGTILRANWKLDDFRTNPIVLFAHNSRDLPIGTASDVRVTDGKLRAKITFNSKELNENAERVWLNVKEKKIRGVSVGFFPHTVKFERHEDKDVLVLDDNELLEISIVPVPSNPKALADMRARAAASREIAKPPEPTPAPAPPVATTETNPAAPERTPNMDPNKPTSSDATPAVARALGLPAGASETDIVAAATRLRELEVQVLAITGVQLSSEAVGAMRALGERSKESERLAKENLDLKNERDSQAFDALIMRGQSEPVKLTPAMAKHYQERFDLAKGTGRASEVVNELKGFIAIAPRVFAESKKPPKGDGSVDLRWNGKTYAELSFSQRAKLKTENKELHALMKRDWEEAGSPAPTAAA